MMLSLTLGLIALGLVFGPLVAIGNFANLDSYHLVVLTNPLLAEFLPGAAIGWLAQDGHLPLKYGPALTALGVDLFPTGRCAVHLITAALAEAIRRRHRAADDRAARSRPQPRPAAGEGSASSVSEEAAA